MTAVPYVMCPSFPIYSRNTIQSEYGELKQKLDEFSMDVEENKKNPISKYDAAITKQSYFNDTLAKQVSPFHIRVIYVPT